MERPEDRVALIEWLDRDGHVQRSVDVAAWPLSLGRALDNTVVLDDPHVAAHHARLAPDQTGQLQLQALPSRNGLQLDGKPVTATTPLASTHHSATLQLGSSLHRVRLVALGRLWRGDFATFWRVPPGYAAGLPDGSSGPVIDQLATHLARIDGAPAPSAGQGPARLDATLRDRVRAFQRAQGLQADGQPGPMTFLQLDSATGGPGPRLQTDPN